MGIVAGGGQAEYLTTPEAQCARVPESLDLVEAGGIPEAFITAHDAMVVQGELMAGQRVLVHAVASGVGTATLQLAQCFGATVAGTSRSKDKLARAAELGLAHPILAPSGFDPAALAAEISAAAGPIDVTVDLLGGPYLGVDVAAAAPKGRVIMVGVIAGGRAELDMLTLMHKRLVLRGTVLRSRPADEKAEATHLFQGQVVPLIARGAVRPVIDAVVPLAEAERGYELVATDRTFGKVVLDLR
jgi:NADPH:quinone reductase-like Zn-dependent oxidoreductase